MIYKLLLISTYLIQLAIAKKSLTVHNNCGSIVTAGVLTNGVSSSTPQQSVNLQTGQSHTFGEANAWGGRVWGRLFCSGPDDASYPRCSVPGPSNPATLAEFFFQGANGRDYYDISLVDGYNLPVTIVPNGGNTPNGFDCGSPTCSIPACPPDYAVIDQAGDVVGCMSACSKTGAAEDCCYGEYNTPETCPQNANAAAVKNQCPDAYSWAFDDQSSTFDCDADGYTVIFC